MAFSLWKPLIRPSSGTVKLREDPLTSLFTNPTLAQVNLHDGEQRTALRAACWAGHLACVKLLLEAGADVDHVDSEGRWGNKHKCKKICGTQA